MKNANIIYIILVLVFIFVSIFFRIKIINLILGSGAAGAAPELSIGERDELNLLRQKNKVLEKDNKNLQSNLGIVSQNQNMSVVKLLLMHSDFYGDFYTSLPKEKTPYKGMNIYANGNIVVGQVKEILDTSLKVGNLAVGIGVIAQDIETGEFMEIHALGNGLYNASIPSGSKIKIGSQIVMKGYPKAIVGEVTELNKSENSLSNVIIQAPYNILAKDIYYVID